MSESVILFGVFVVLLLCNVPIAAVSYTHLTLPTNSRV